MPVVMKQYTAPPTRALPPAEHRARILEAMALVVARKGYQATTISDIVAAANVSRRTFYEQFYDKPACLVALFESAAREALLVLRRAIDIEQPWHAQVERALTAYFRALADNPILLRTLYVEILALGRDGLAARRRVNQDLTDFLLEVVNGDMLSEVPLPRHLAMAIVGGINEMVLEYMEREQVDRLTELAQPAAQLVGIVTVGCLTDSEETEQARVA
jgi:AcrR family transcriptional regulator